MKTQINHLTINGPSLYAAENQSKKKKKEEALRIIKHGERKTQNVKQHVKMACPVHSKDTKLYPKKLLKGKLYTSLQFGC